MGALNIDKLNDLRKKVIEYLEEQLYWGRVIVKNEEQTKNWLILPFLSALGYDTQSTDVVPEVTADFSKKGEKVDYMLQVDNRPAALIECKKFGESLDKHVNQLYRYFQAKNVHIGILTNGVVYHFFTDSNRENVMDTKPYLELDITTDDLELLNDYTRDNILQAPIPSIVNKRKKQEQQKEQEISNYKHQISDYESQINELQDKLSKQKDESGVDEQMYNAMLVQHLIMKDKLESENKQLKEQAKPKKEKKIYGNTDLDKHKVPDDIARDMVALLPEEVFVPEAKFFDPFCRYGELLMDVKDRLMKSQHMIKAFPDEDDREDHIRDNQLYAFVIDEKGLKDVTRIIHRTSSPREPHVVCFGDEAVYKAAMKSDSKVFILEKLKELGQMKFDVVIGNPPYNNDIYLDFVEIGHNLASQYTVMVTPAKWQAKGGKKNEDFRKNIVPYMSKIVYYPVATDIFDIKEWDGITYYLVDKQLCVNKEIENKCIWQKLFNSTHYRPIGNHLNNAVVSILDKVRGAKGFSTLTVSYDSSFYLTASDVKELSVIDINEFNIPIIGGDSQGNMITVGYCSNRHPIKNAETIGMYKVIMHCMPGRNSTLVSDGTTYGNSAIKILEPNECCKNAYLVLFTSYDKNEVESFGSYLNTRFIRLLTYCGCVGSQAGCDEFWRFVPAPEAFDHIFTDQELYKKYGLTDDEIAIIESVIKERK